jgi:xanthine dehydrogenase molybdopterin-binding subunit B
MPPGTLYLAILRSHRAHARITGVDLSVTRAAAGGRLALGGADLAGRIGARARRQVAAAGRLKQ